MEEKQKKSGMGFAIVLMLISIFAIAILSYFVYYLLNAREDDTEKLNQLKTQVTSLQSSVTNLGRQMTRERDEKEEPNVDAIAEELFNKGAEYIGKVNYCDYPEYQKVEPAETKEQNGKVYYKTVEKYSDVKDEYAQVFGGAALTKILGKRFLDVDGTLYVSEGGATGYETKADKLEKVSENNGEVSYKVTATTTEEESTTTDTCNMTIKKVDDAYVIVAINLGVMGL